MKTTGLDFAAITEQDIDSVLEIEQQSFESPWSRISFLEELSCKNSLSFGARFSPGRYLNQIIAYICFRLIADELHIMRIAVALQWQCHGLGSRILEKSLSIGLEKGAVSSFLEVSSSNHKAIKLYSKFGFQVIGKRKGYYQGTGEDALVLMKNLE